MKSTAVRDGGDWILTGSKTHINLGADCDVTLFYAIAERRADLLPGRHDAARHPHPRHRAIGLRLIRTADVEFDQVRVPDAARLGPAGGGAADLPVDVQRQPPGQRLRADRSRPPLARAGSALRRAPARSGTTSSPTSRASSGRSPTRGRRCRPRRSPATTRPSRTRAARTSRCTRRRRRSSRSPPPSRRRTRRTAWSAVTACTSTLRTPTSSTTSRSSRSPAARRDHAQLHRPPGPEGPRPRGLA